MTSPAILARRSGGILALAILISIPAGAQSLFAGGDDVPECRVRPLTQ